MIEINAQPIYEAAARIGMNDRRLMAAAGKTNQLTIRTAKDGWIDADANGAPSLRILSAVLESLADAGEHIELNQILRLSG